MVVKFLKKNSSILPGIIECGVKYTFLSQNKKVNIMWWKCRNVADFPQTYQFTGDRLSVIEYLNGLLSPSKN